MGGSQKFPWNKKKEINNLTYMYVYGKKEKEKKSVPS